jgi:transcriptional regulator with XRE-family HTH domain
MYTGYCNMTFGDYLLEKRKTRKLSQEDLAADAGLSRNYISVIERNQPHHITGAEPQPSRETVKRLAAALGVPDAEALNAAGYSGATIESNNDNFPRLKAFYDELPPDGQDELVEIAFTLWKRRNRTTHGTKAE